MLLTLVILIAAWTAIGWGLATFGARQRGDARSATLSADGALVELGNVAMLTVRAYPPSMLAMDQPLQPRDVLFVVDRSSSMGSGPGSALDELLRAMGDFLSAMPKEFRSGIVLFDSNAQIAAPLSADHAHNRDVLRSITRGGGTSIAAGLRKSHEAISEANNATPVNVIVLTDGGDHADEVVGEARALRESGRNVSVTCIGFGAGTHMSLLERFSDPGQSFLLQKPEEIRGLFDFLSARITGRAPVAAVLECEIEEPAPWRFVEDRQQPVLGRERVGDVLTVSWLRPVLGDKPLTFAIGLEARCPGWKRTLRAVRIHWRSDEGRAQTVSLASVPRLLVLPGWLSWCYPVVNPLMEPLLARLGCIHETQAQPAPTTAGLSPASFTPLSPPGSAPYSPIVTPTLVVCLGEAGHAAGELLVRRMRDRGIDARRMPKVSVILGQGDIAPTGSGIVHLNVDTRPWVVDANREVVPPTREFVPAAEWLSRGEVLHTYFGVGENRALARLALLQEPQDVMSAIEKAVAGGVPIEQVVVLASVQDAASNAIALEVAHMCAPLGVPCSFLLSASPRLSSDRAPEAAFAAELDRVLSCRGEWIVSDRGGIESKQRRVLDSVIVVGDRFAASGEASVALVDAAWTMLAYPPARKMIDDSLTNGFAQMRIEASSAPRLLLWEAIREKMIADLLVSWVQGKETMESAAAQMRRRADDALTRFWNGGEHMPAYPPHFQMIAAPHATRGAAPTAAPAAWRQEQDGGRAFADYLDAWLRVELHQRDEVRWPLYTLLTALRRIEEQLQISAAAYAGSATTSGNADDLMVTVHLAQQYQSIAAGVAEHVAQWQERLIGDPLASLPTEMRFGGLVETCAETGATLLDDALTDLPDDARRSLDKRYQEWFAAKAPEILSRLGFWTQRSAQGEIQMQLIGPGGNHANLPDVAESLKRWLDDFANETMGLLDAVALRPFKAGISGFCIGARAEALGGLRPADGLAADPAFVAAIELTPLPPHIGLGVGDLSRQSGLPYVWPEEVHAARIRRLYENLRGERQPSLSGQAVSTLRDPRRVLSLLLKIRDGAVVQRAGMLFEGAQQLGPAFEGKDAVVEFARTLRAAAPCDDWPQVGQSADAFVASLEALDIFRTLRDAAGWEEWRSVIVGIVLDSDAHHRRAAMKAVHA